jgi:hypothetical protein
LVSPEVTAIMPHDAPKEVAMSCISTLVLPVPQSEVAYPLFKMTQGELITVPVLYPTTQPTSRSPVGLAMESEPAHRAS